MTKKQDDKVIFRDSGESLVENRKHNKSESGRFHFGNESRSDTITTHFATPPNPDKVSGDKTKK
ncbi:hypothetical protein [Cognaticolwellia mytili]|uniref:hypothetical protein n=1 Tax=Cognaticolwellia mytili TaxID=1888913 RepID=UPI000A16DD01|nr:hypothetical protein [Cognaticolwellia mytili]